MAHPDSPVSIFPASPSKHLQNPCKSLLAKHTEYNNRNRPGKQIRRLQIDLRQIELLADRPGGNTDDFRRHTGFPAHPDRRLRSTDKERSQCRAVDSRKALSRRNPEDLRHLQKITIRALKAA